jgi:hypothetical protein
MGTRTQRAGTLVRPRSSTQPIPAWISRPTVTQARLSTSLQPRGTMNSTNESLPEHDEQHQTRPRPDLAELARSVRRLTFAVWCLVGLLAALYATPYVSYFLSSRAPAQRSDEAPSPETSEVPYAVDFDNDFHARPVGEKVKRASVILLTQLRKDGGQDKAIVREIIKHAANVRFYYKVGDEFEMLSHIPTSTCSDCEGDGQVVFLLGNPAQMASSYSYEHDRIDGMGGLTLAELRELAQSPAKAGK